MFIFVQHQLGKHNTASKKKIKQSCEPQEDAEGQSKATHKGQSGQYHCMNTHFHHSRQWQVITAAYRNKKRARVVITSLFGIKQGRSPFGATTKNGSGKNKRSAGRFGLDKLVLMPPWEKFKRGPKELGSPPESIGWCKP